MLLLILGTADGMIYCLEADAMADQDKEWIRRHSTRLDSMGLADRIETIKRHIPRSMRAYKTIYSSNVVLVNQFKLPGESTQ